MSSILDCLRSITSPITDHLTGYQKKWQEWQEAREIRHLIKTRHVDQVWERQAESRVFPVPANTQLGTHPWVGEAGRFHFYHIPIDQITVKALPYQIEECIREIRSSLFFCEQLPLNLQNPNEIGFDFRLVISIINSSNNIEYYKSFFPNHIKIELHNPIQSPSLSTEIESPSLDQLRTLLFRYKILSILCLSGVFNPEINQKMKHIIRFSLEQAPDRNAALDRVFFRNLPLTQAIRGTPENPIPVNDDDHGFHEKQD